MYYLLRIFVWLALKIFCKTVRVNRPDLFKIKGPLILACNHPNAFLDAIILGSLFHEPVHFLARGDVFRNSFIKRILGALQLIPVYRLSEGREYLSLNEASFDKCQKILSSGGIVLIFAEGLCLNQWMLRPMKKGTARIALAAMNETGISSEIRILPVSLNYNSFRSPGKTLLIHFGEIISKKDLASGFSEAEKMHYFNGLLAERLSAGMLQSASHPQTVQVLLTNHHRHSIPRLKSIQAEVISENATAVFQKLKMPGSISENPLFFSLDLLQILILLVPAGAGWILHAPFYLLLKKIIGRKTKGTVFFDSIMFVALVLSYPLYWLLVNILIQPLTTNEWISLLILFMPLLGWAAIYWKENLLRVRNYLALNEKERDFLRRTLNA